MKYFASLFFILNAYICLACDLPRITSIKNLMPNTVELKWADTNPTKKYRLAYNTVQDTATAITTLEDNTNVKIISNLKSASTYYFWIKSNCESSTNAWQGPYSFVTALAISNDCNLNLPIADNSCFAGGSTYDIFVEGVNNQRLLSVALIIEHPFPKELTIDLVNPNGEQTTLVSAKAGRATNLGELHGMCNEPCIFTDLAVEGLAESDSLTIGAFKPDVPLSKVNTGMSDGKWQLRICDAGISDFGSLKFVKLNFDNSICRPIDEFYFSKIGSTEVQLNWKNQVPCAQVQIAYKEQSQTSFSLKEFVACNPTSNKVINLKPNTVYDFYLIAECMQGITALPSAIKSIATLCAKADIQETFELQKKCLPACNLGCEYNSVFKNVKSDDADWIVYDASTPTRLTGPDLGYTGGGGYVYVEANSQLCGKNTTAILQSKCLEPQSSSVTCDMSFAYHMYGSDIGQLILEKSTNQGATWSSVFAAQGDKGDRWHFTSLQTPQSSDPFILRFKAITKEGKSGDIAVDHVSLSGYKPLDGYTFYRDQDGDGFGSIHDSLVVCSKSSLAGYTMQGGDCNDGDGAINPSKQEIACNGIDENCDAKIDTKSSIFNVQLKNTRAETCSGKKDGALSISVSGGLSPYSYKWSNGAITDSISNVEAGNYQCTVTDRDGCQVVVSDLTVSKNSSLDLKIDKITNTSCLGLKNGEITIIHNQNFSPFTYLWSDGSNKSVLANAEVKNYSVTVSNKLGCTESIQNIAVGFNSVLNAKASQVKKPSCYGYTNGAIEIGVTNAQTPIIYKWSTGEESPKISNLKGGVYKVTVTDGTGCQNRLEINLTEPDPLVLKPINVENVTCPKLSDGEIALQTRGGSIPYAYQWSDGHTASIDMRTKLKKGTYHVTVYDDEGCTQVLHDLVVDEPLGFNFTLIKIAPSSCLGKSDGLAEVELSGGKAPYRYLWNGIQKENISQYDLLPGVYNFTAIDQNFCKYSAVPITIGNLNMSSASNLEILHTISCFNDGSGSVVATTKSASPPFTYVWSNGTSHKSDQMTDTLINLNAGKYTVTITDHDQCSQASNALQLVSPPSLTYTLSTVENKCKGDAKGEVKIDVNGGTPPYVYIWNTGSNDSILVGLENGGYQCTIKDRLNCEVITAPITVNSTSNIAVTKIVEPTEQDLAIGRIILIPYGGVGNYRITWTGLTSKEFSLDSLASDWYRFKIEDDMGCVVFDSVFVARVTSIADEKFKMALYPNPAKDNLTVKIEGEEMEIEIIDINGRLRKKEELKEEEKQIDIKELEGGVYIMKIKRRNKQMNHFYFSVIK